MKVRALAGKPVEVRGLQPRMAVGGEIAPAPIVGEDEDDVGVGGWGSGRQRGGEGEKEGKREGEKGAEVVHGAD